MSQNRPGPSAAIRIDAPFDHVAMRLKTPAVNLEDSLIGRLRSVCEQVDTDPESRVEAGRDWWPLALRWATEGMVASLAGAVARPSDAAQVSAVLGVCNASRVPVTAFAGRSGVCGGSVPVFGGVSVDMGGLSGLVDVDDRSLIVEARAGIYGDELEQGLRRDHALTLGHWPQSIELSTLGGWIACRSAGQYSTRYGKIEDMVAGLEVALATGKVAHTGGRAPRTATGPDLTQLFVGSEGTLGLVTSALVRAHPVAAAERRKAVSFEGFDTGLEVCRRILRRGATPAVLRLYDEKESSRTFGTERGCVLIVLDEGDPALVEATARVVTEECARTGSVLDEALVDTWLEHRNDVSALGGLTRAGIVVDTVEVAGRWSALGHLYESAVQRVEAVPGTLVASAHQSHSYTDGACLYFTFAGRAPQGSGPEWADSYYNAAWDAIMSAALEQGCAISHHHGVGLNRGRRMEEQLGPEGFAVLVAVKGALDPNGILNPGKLGLPSPYGEVGWP